MKKSKQFVEIIRLKNESPLSERMIGRIVGASHQTVGRCIKRWKKSGVSLAELKELEPEQVMTIRFPKAGRRHHNHRIPNWEDMCKRLQRKGMTRRFFYLEYAEQDSSTAMKYSTFCREFRKYCQSQKLSMKLTHKAGETLQSDYAGATLECSFASKPIQFIVATCSFSSLIHVRATPRQTTDDWICGHISAFESFGGLTEIIVPDNPAPVVSSVRPILTLNPKFEAFANHYGVTVLPARPGHPQDKALGELSVKIFTQRILPILRQHKFGSLEALNKFLAKEVDKFNQENFQKRNVSRQELFDKFVKPILNELTPTRFEPIVTIMNVTIPSNYTVLYDEHYYSVPYRYAHKLVQVHVYATRIEVWFGHKLIAQHSRSFEKGCFTKEKGHLHPDHLWFDDKPLAHYEEWATETFNSDVVTTFIRHLFTSKYTLSRRGNQHCREFQKLCKNAEVDDVIGACAYAIAHGHENNWNMFKHILKSGVFKSLPATSSSIPSNSIIRGGHYFENAGVQL
mgnify:CR=1 FL=1|tara:strand:- start:8239 stop:9777 length:1539 start_codon:yes stop_codon:yes gene_type:complete